MTDADLIAAFLDLRADIDSVPFEHEQQWSGTNPRRVPRDRTR